MPHAPTVPVPQLETARNVKMKRPLLSKDLVSMDPRNVKSLSSSMLPKMFVWPMKHHAQLDIGASCLPSTVESVPVIVMARKRLNGKQLKNKKSSKENV